METHSKALLMANAKYYTLTVSTNPASATCTLTYGGNSYSSKTATVKKGTIISYSVYHSTYGTTTGNITMDSDKTLTCEGTYSTGATTYTKNVTQVGSLTYDNTTSDISGFDDRNYATISPPDWNSASSWKLSMKVKARSLIGLQTIFSNGYAGSGIKNRGITLRFNATTLQMYWGVGNTTVHTLSKTGMSTNTFYNISAEFDGSTYYLKVDGVSAASKALSTHLSLGDYLTPTIGQAEYKKYSNGLQSASYCTFNLKYCFININGTRYWTGATAQTAYNYYWDTAVV